MGGGDGGLRGVVAEIEVNLKPGVMLDSIPQTPSSSDLCGGAQVLTDTRLSTHCV